MQGFGVCSSDFLVSTTLVGGHWNDSVRCGLWYWNLNGTSSEVWTNVGARLLMCRDLMCRFRCLPRDLSAAILLTPLGVVCGVGI